MRIALVTPSFLPRIGGAEFVVHHLALQWADQGHEVRVMNCITDQATHADGEYTVRRFKLLRGSTRFGYHRFPMGWHAVRGLKRLLDEFRPEFISAHFGYPMGVWLAMMKPVPKFLITCHGQELAKFPWGFRAVYKIDRILTDALNASAGAIAISTEMRRVMEEMGVRPEKILDIPNGVDLERFRIKPDFNLRQKFDLPADAVVVLGVGREHPQKAYDKGIRAFAKVAAKVPEAYYLILGRGTDKWRPLADELGIGRQIVFCEGLYGDELVGAYHQANIFYSPSDFEAFALVVIEAMAVGLPAVVTNISGSQDVIHNGENGFVVERGQTGEMAEALYRLIKDDEMRARFGAVNLERSTHYGWDRISRLYLSYC